MLSLELVVSQLTNALATFLVLSSVQNSERGKKIGTAMVNTSRNVMQTGKAVGKKFVCNQVESMCS